MRLTLGLCDVLLYAGGGILPIRLGCQAAQSQVQELPRDTLRALVEIDSIANRVTGEAAQAVSRGLIRSKFTADDIQILPPTPLLRD
jgi:hypothetical protein